MSRALIAIIGTYALVPLFCTPIYFCFTIQTFAASGAPNATLYKVYKLIGGLQFLIYCLFELKYTITKYFVCFKER